jgi:hypothetical protein
MWGLFSSAVGSRQDSPVSRRDRLAVLVAIATAALTAVAFFVSSGTRFLMPGPLTSAHAAIGNCSSCHAKNGSGKLSWIGGLAANSLVDSKACLNCHQMPKTAFFPHSASPGVLLASAKSGAKLAATNPVPYSARIQNTAFPAHSVTSRGLFCATCHQEHQGAKADLTKISNEQCRSCHSLKFDSFDDGHPEFSNYPYGRRTPIIYDHVSHFDKHFPEVAKKEPAKRIPQSCSSCHDTHEDKRIMSVAPFEKTCAGCHLDQITGKARATGPKGIAFLSLPELDLQTLKQKKVAIGEWPEASEARLTPFMKIMIGRSEKGRATLSATENLKLEDLTKASDAQIAAVNDLAWEIKRLFYALIASKTSELFAQIDIGGNAGPRADLISDLTAGMPRDVVVAAQQQWLPNLAREIEKGPVTAEVREPGSDRATSRSAEADPTEPPRAVSPPSDAAGKETESSDKQAGENKYDEPACVMRVFGQCLMPSSQAQSDSKGEANKNSGKMPEPMRAGLADAAPPQAGDHPAASRTDELLFPTDSERQEMKSYRKGGPRAPVSGAGSPPDVSDREAVAAPVSEMESKTDPESWAEGGGWYRQDNAIFYRPTGHKDRFIYSWMTLTRPKARRGDRGAFSSVFDLLTSKDAQGSCTKCHSIDDASHGGRLVNFAQPSIKANPGSFTAFAHEPHFGVMGIQGCLACHALQKDRPYLKSFDKGDPHTFSSNFSSMKKELCQSCHAATKVRQDCLTCHSYHVQSTTTPIINTRVPTP